MHARRQLNNPGFLYSSFCEGDEHFWLLLGKISEELSGETVEKVTKSRSSKTNPHVVPLACHELIRESVDSLCRDGADAQYMQYF